MCRNRNYGVRIHREKLLALGRKEDLKLLFRMVEGLAACHSMERVIAQVEMITSKWDRVKEHFLKPVMK